VDSLASAPEAARLLSRYFEVWLLRLGGLFPDLRSCSECGGRIGDEDNAYLDEDVRVHCKPCSRSSALRLLRETQRAVIAIQRLTPIQFAAQFGQLPEQAEAQLAELTHRLIVRALERRPRTLV